MQNTRRSTLNSSQISHLELAADSRQFVRQTIEIAAPLVWSPEPPHLYELAEVIRDERTELHRFSGTTGLIMIAMDAKHGDLATDELSDVWNHSKSSFDYGLDFAGWWERDLEVVVSNGTAVGLIDSSPQEP